MKNYTAAIAQLRPGAEWTLSDASDLSTLTWHDNAQKRPTDAEIEATTFLSALTAYAAAKRYAVETGGVTVGGVSIPSDRDTQAKLTAAFLLAQVNPQASFQWKTSTGFVTLDAASVGQIAVAIGQFVQASYAAETTVLAAIAAGTITTTAQIDAATWPSNS